MITGGSIFSVDGATIELTSVIDVSKPGFRTGGVIALFDSEVLLAFGSEIEIEDCGFDGARGRAALVTGVIKIVPLV